jgi:hypothetical protein
MSSEELREKIYKEQFWEYNYDEGCEKANEVLKSIENISRNPLLLDYVLKSLSKNQIELKEYFYIIAHQEYRNKIYDTIIDKIFNSIEEAEEYARIGEFPVSLMFEKYSIKSINSKK